MSLGKKKGRVSLVILWMYTSSVYSFGFSQLLGGAKNLMGGAGGMGGGAVQADYNAQRDTIIPGWSAGVVEKHDGKDVVCFDGNCKEGDRKGSTPNRGQTPNGIFAPPPNVRQPGEGRQRQPRDDEGPSDDGAGSESDLNPYDRPNAPFYPPDPNEGGVKASPGGSPGGLAGQVGMPYAALGGPASGFGDNTTKDDAMGVIFSIGDEDTFAIVTNVSLALPLKTFVSKTSLTGEEMTAQDRKDFLTEELEGKGSVLRFDTGLNILFSPKMTFYIPRTALSLIVEVGRLIYPKSFIDFMRSRKMNTQVFIPMKDTDGSLVYYLPVYNAATALPNPQLPIVSQVLTTIEGYGLSLTKAIRLDIDKGILVLQEPAYPAGDIQNAVDSLQKFISGELSNPFRDMAGKYNFGEPTEEQDNDESSYSYSTSDEEEREEGSTASSSSASSSSESDERKARTGRRPRRSIEGYLKVAQRLREKAATMVDNERGQRDALRKAKKAEAKAEKLRQQSYNEQLLSARAGSSSDASEVAKASSSATAASIASESGSIEVSKGGITNSESTLSGSSWSASTTTKNTSVERVISSKQQMSESQSSAYEASSKESIEKAFSASAASSILSSHESNDTYYQSISSSEYASREMKQSLMSISMQHSAFSSFGSMYKSEAYSSYGVKSETSSRRWLSQRMQSLSSMRKWMQSSSRTMSKATRSASKRVSAAASKQQMASQAAMESFKKAATAQRSATAAAANQKRAQARGDTKATRSYHRQAAAHKKAYARHSADGDRFAAAAQAFQAEKLAECAREAAVFAEQTKNPDQNATKEDLVTLQKTVAQVLTSSQIQVLSKVLSPVQIRVLTKMLTPLQVQQTLVHIGAMTPEQIQGFLIKLQLKGLELQAPDLPEAPLPGLLQGAVQPLNPLAMDTLNKIKGEEDVPMTASDLQKYLLQGQLLFQIREELLTPFQIEQLKLRATQQTRVVQSLISQIETQKKQIEVQVKKQMQDERMQSTLGTCNPVLGFQTGAMNGATDGLVSAPGLKLGGEVALNGNAYAAIQQIISSPAVAAFTGLNAGTLSQLVYGQMSKNDMMCILTKAMMNRPAYVGILPEERNLLNARYNRTEGKMLSMYGGALPRMEQAVVSAFNLVNSSSVKCGGQTPNAISPKATCQIVPQ